MKTGRMAKVQSLGRLACHRMNFQKIGTESLTTQQGLKTMSIDLNDTSVWKAIRDLKKLRQSSDIDLDFAKHFEQTHRCIVISDPSDPFGLAGYLKFNSNNDELIFALKYSSK
jgi:hypothetical protein